MTRSTTEDVQAACDEAVTAAAHVMLHAGAPVGMILDRLLTYAAAQACALDGSPTTAKNFRTFAEKIDGGLFHTVTGEQSRH